MLTTPIGNFGTGTVAQVIQDLTRTRGGVQQHVLLGEIAFNLITYFEGVESRFSANYAEHALIEGKPRLQFVGDNLDEYTWHMVLHAGFCDPELELLKLRAALAQHEALPLVYASGDYKGLFIPTEAGVTFQQTFADGKPIWIEADLTLREYVQPPVDATQKQEPVAAEKSGANGTTTTPAQTVKKTPTPRATTAPPTRAEKQKRVEGFGT